MTLTDGRILIDKLKSYSNAPGYRDISLVFDVDRGTETETVELNISKEDAFELMEYILSTQKIAWKGGPPIDADDSEEAPSIVYCG